MNKEIFSDIFHSSIIIALDMCRNKYHKFIPSDFLIKISLMKNKEKLHSFNEAVNIIYINDNEFYKSIDIFVKEIFEGKSIIFVAVSGHDPDIYDNTWDRDYLGPFKPTVLENIKL